VVFVTAFGGSEVEAEALRLGATCYMDKPFRVARLLDVLRAAVDQPTRAAQGQGWGEDVVGT
jgi:FixJ family two-component response regulator